MLSGGRAGWWAREGSGGQRGYPVSLRLHGATGATAAAHLQHPFRKQHPVHQTLKMLALMIPGSGVWGGGRTALRALPSAGEKAAGAKAEAVDSATRRSAVTLNIILRANLIVTLSRHHRGRPLHPCHLQLRFHSAFQSPWQILPRNLQHPPPPPRPPIQPSGM